MSKKMLGSDYLLLLLYLNNHESIKGAVRLTKMMFLFKEQISPVLKSKGLDSGKLPDFIAYNYGPFSKDVYEQVELFSGIGFIRIKDLFVEEEMSDADNVVEKEFIDECYEDENELKRDSNYWEYCIAERGIGFIEKELLPEITEEQMHILEEFKKKITEMPIKQLLYYVYTKYPDYTKKSLIVNEVLNNGN